MRSTCLSRFLRGKQVRLRPRNTEAKQLKPPPMSRPAHPIRHLMDSDRGRNPPFFVCGARSGHAYLPALALRACRFTRGRGKSGNAGK